MENQDRFILWLHAVRQSLGEFAWVLLGVLLLLGVLIGWLTLRWILRGGMSAARQREL